MEHDPTTGTGPSTTGNEHNPNETGEATSPAPDAIETTNANETTQANGLSEASPRDPHLVVRGRRLEASCIRPNESPEQQGGN